ICSHHPNLVAQGAAFNAALRIAAPWCEERARSTDGPCPLCWLCPAGLGGRLLRPRALRDIESLRAIRSAITCDTQITARLNRLDHPAIARRHGWGDLAIAIIDDGIDLMSKRADVPLHLGLDAFHIAIGGDRELAEIDEQHAQLGIVCEAPLDRHR